MLRQRSAADLFAMGLEVISVDVEILWCVPLAFTMTVGWGFIMVANAVM